MTSRVTVNREDVLKARLELLEKEKAHSRAGDELAELRRALPQLEIEQDYVFQGPDGPIQLSDLFEGRSQLIIQHIMFGPEWEAGPICSFGQTVSTR